MLLQTLRGVARSESSGELVLMGEIDGREERLVIPARLLPPKVPVLLAQRAKSLESPVVLETIPITGFATGSVLGGVVIRLQLGGWEIPLTLTEAQARDLAGRLA